MDDLIAYLKAEIANREELIDHLHGLQGRNSKLFFYVGERSAFRDMLRRLTPVPVDAAAQSVAAAQAQPEPTAVTGGTAEHHR